MITVCGKGVSLAQLRKIKPVTPENAGRRWAPIQHGELVDAIRDEVAGRGWGIEKEIFTTAREGSEMAGALLLNKVPGVETMPGITLALGFLNSNARRKALRLTVGASVTCCTNGLCTGTILINRVHDHTVDVFEEVESAIDRYTMAAAMVPETVRAMRNRFLTPNEANGVLMEAGRRKLIGWTAIGRVDREYRNPTFAEHGRDNAWALLNAFTFAARPNIRDIDQMEAYNTFRRLIPGAPELN